MDDQNIEFCSLLDVLATKYRIWGKGCFATAKEKLPTMTTSALCNRLQDNFVSGGRISAYFVSEELTRRGVPPYLRSLAQPLPDFRECNVNQRFDLLLYDLEWIVHAYPEHKTNAPGYMRIFRPGKDFFRGAEHISKRGNREPWRIARDMGLSADQQWDCQVVRGREIALERKYIRERRLAYMDYFRSALEAGKRCGQTPEQQKQTRTRRFNLWLCSRIAGRKNLQEVARRYEQLTGEKIDRRIVGRQLEMIPNRLRPISS